MIAIAEDGERAAAKMPRRAATTSAWAVETFARKGSSGLAARLATDDFRPPLGLGMGLVSQGGIAVAMVMDYYQLGSTELTGLVVTIVLIAVIVNELVSPSLARHVLRTAGEIAP